MAVNTVTAAINGQTYTLTQNSQTGKYEATITAPQKSSFTQSGGYFNVTVKATDEAGNSTTKDAADTTLGSSLRLVVKEKAAPIITITAPTVSQMLTNNKPVIKWTVTDADSGVNSSTISIAIDSGSKITSGITKIAITGGYECTYTPSTVLTDGSHTIKVDASDNDGNAAAQKNVTFKIDTVPPALSITSPTNGLVTNNNTCVVNGTTDDLTSSPVTATVKLNSGSTASVTVNADGSFSKSLSLVQGTNTITVTATDAAGKTTTITRTVTLDTTAPVIKSVAIASNPVNAGSPFVITVEVTD